MCAQYALMLGIKREEMILLRSHQMFLWTKWNEKQGQVCHCLIQLLHQLSFSFLICSFFYNVEPKPNGKYKIEPQQMQIQFTPLVKSNLASSLCSIQRLCEV